MTNTRRRFWRSVPGVWVVRSLAGLLLAACVASAGCAGPPQAVEPLLTPEQQALNVESFEYVWATIRDKHFDPELNGVDWAAVREELLPEVEQAERMSQARAVMSDLIGRLGQSHFAIFPAEVYKDLEVPAGEGSRDGSVGIELRLIEGRPLVTRVEEGSPAAEAGVHPGWEILRVGEAETAPIIERIEQADLGPIERQFVVVRGVGRRLLGQMDSTVEVAFLDGDGREVELALTRAVRPDKRIEFGHLPAMYSRFESREIADDIGYIAFSVFFDPMTVMTAFGDAVRSFMDADGIIIDVRGNPGGIGAMAMGMSGWLVDARNQYLGTMKTRDTELKFVLNPRVETYQGPVAILVDELSGSTTEIFTGGLQDLGRARIFGSRTAGAVLPSAIERLPNGDGFQYAFAGYVSASGKVLEGNGVTPDQEVVHTRKALLAGRDLVMEAAVEWIRGQS